MGFQRITCREAISRLMQRVVLLGFILMANTAFGQGLPSTGGGGSEPDTLKKFQFVPVPYINYDRSLGFSIGAIPMAMYPLSKNDSLSPSSISGLMGMYTTNKTWFFMGFSRWYVDNDNYRVTAAIGLGDVNFQFYSTPIGGFVNYNTAINFGFAEVQRRVVKKLYAGINYIYLDFDTSFGGMDSVRVQNEFHGLGAVLSYDGRNNVYYPTKGFLTDINYTTYPEFFGNTFHSQKIEIDYNQYWPVSEQHVVAARAYLGLGIGTLTFNQQFIVGQTDIRGYTQGAYRGDQIVALQGEYRYNFKSKWGLVGFLGFATIYGSLNSDQDGTVLPGIGTGFRYVVFPRNHMNVGMDIALGKNDWGIYFKIGEAF